MKTATPRFVTQEETKTASQESITWYKRPKKIEPDRSFLLQVFPLEMYWIDAKNIYGGER